MIGRSVQGYCPMGCGATLVLVKGHVTCSWHACPDPAKVGEILADPESEHIVQIEEESFTVLHPLRERPELFECLFHEELSNLDGPPVQPGHYRVTRYSNALQFERVG